MFSVPTMWRCLPERRASVFLFWKGVRWELRHGNCSSSWSAMKDKSSALAGGYLRKLKRLRTGFCFVVQVGIW